LGKDGNLSSQLENVRQGAQNLGHASPASDFITQGVAELLRVIALLLDGALAVANAFLDGVLGMIDSMLAMLLDPKMGWLTQPIDIPVLAWLYQKIFGQPLTELNVVTLARARAGDGGVARGRGRVAIAECRAPNGRGGRWSPENLRRSHNRLRRPQCLRRWDPGRDRRLHERAATRRERALW
jgi:hypothetical protein